MKDGFQIVYNFMEENQIDTMEKFTSTVHIFPDVIQQILAHKHEEFKFDKEDMEKLYVWLSRDDESLPRA
jgi:hypothetical protein